MSQQIISPNDHEGIFQFAEKMNKEAARHVPLERVSFGKNVAVQSEREFLLWHAACCMNELTVRAQEFTLTVEQLQQLRGAVVLLQGVTEGMTNPR